MELIFVYNAKSSLSNKAFDFAHKILSPDTYSCELCSITHHQIGERQAWKDFREKSDYNMSFLYKNEFEEKFKAHYNYPIILLKNDKNQLHLLMDKEAISAHNTADTLSAALIKLLSASE